MTNLIAGYDAALFDLDGVIYLGPNSIPGVPETIAELRATDVKVGFVTNNAARTPAAVATHLSELGVAAASHDVVNSTQATLRMLRNELPEGAKVLPVGTAALVEQLTEAGFVPVAGYEDDPVAVVQGYHPKIEWELLEAGALAIQRGARWYATNPDLTRPTEKGITPGCGAQVAVVRACVTVDPKMAGKPFPPLLEETTLRLRTDNPIFVGDRIDTDIMGAHSVGMDSLFVFTGAHGKEDLACAPPHGRPTYLGYDFTALLAPPRTANLVEDAAQCGAQRVANRNGSAQLLTQPQGREEQLDALWAGLKLSWEQGIVLDELLSELDELR